MNSDYSSLKVNVDSSINGVDNKLIKINNDIKNDIDCYDEKQEIDKKKNKWCCFYIRLPITGKLEKKTLTFIIITLLIDALSNTLLFFATHHWWFINGYPLNYISWDDVKTDFISFHDGTSDTILLWLIRVISLYILTCIAISKGAPSELWKENESKCCCLFGCCKRHKLSHKQSKKEKDDRKNTNYAIQKLLSNDDDNDNDNNDDKVVQPIVSAIGLSSDVIKKKNKNKKEEEEEDDDDELDEEIEGIEDKRRLQPKFDNKNDMDFYEKRKQKAVAYKYGILLLMFLLCTIYQSYIGIKCVTFNFQENNSLGHYETCQAILFGICVICINIEIFLFKQFIESATDLGECIIVKSLHPHPLKQRKKVKFWCDLCRSRAKYCTYRCDDCHFDVCSDCYKKEKKKLKKKQEESVSKNKQSSMKDGGDLKKSIKISAASESYKYENESVRVENDPTMSSQKELTSTKYMLRALSLCLPHIGLIIIALSCLIINSISNLLLPRSQGFILDKIVSNNHNEFIYEIKYYLILSIIVGLFGSIRTLCFRFTIRRLMVSIRSLMFSNIIIQNIQFFDDMSTGELISRMTNDIGGMLTPLRTMLQTTLSNIILLFGGLIMCFITSWRLSMLAFTTVAPVLFLTQQYAKWSKNINRAIWAAFGSSTQIAQQAFSNIRTVRAFGTEIKEIKNYDNALQEILERGLINAIASTITFSLTNYLDLGCSILILYFGGLTILHQDNGNNNNIHTELTIGKLITFQLYWNMINSAYKGLQNVLTAFTRGAGAAQRVLTLLDHISNKENNLYSGLNPIPLDGNIFIENVYFNYKSRPENNVLQGINLNIKPGQVIALVGRSGGGKSTLIHLLMRFYDVTNGKIFYNKNKLPLNKINLTKLRENIGLVAQDTQLFDCTIKENIIYGVIDEKRKDEITMNEIIYYSKLANCHEFIIKFEEGYNTRVGERGIRLSGGQKQRIAIARMLMKKPKILFLDEATSNLDTESEALVQAAIDKTIWYNDDNDDDSKENNNDDNKYQFKANAVILVAHRLSTVINADKIAVIDKGKIVEFGNHDELLQIKDGVYHKLVERQIQREENQLNQDIVEEEQEQEQEEENQQSKDKKKKKKKKKTIKKKNVASDDIDSLFDNK